MGEDLFPIGRVVKPHGIKGKIKVEYFGEEVSHFLLYQEIIIQDGIGHPKTYKILEVIPQPPRLILQLKGIESIEEATRLLGKEILIKREALPVLEEGEYYWFELMGLEVQTETGKRIGKVKGIFPTGAHDIYVVEGIRGEIYLPAREEVIRQIELQKGVMRVARMEGLWEEEDEV